MEEQSYQASEMAQLDLASLEDEQLPEGHKSGFVAVAGRPNVGKSTLMNAFLKQKVAIVTPRPQTTRTRQLGILTKPEFQIIFVDTPGLIKPRHKLDEFMVATAEEAVHDADIVLWLVDASEPPGDSDRIIAETMRSLPEHIHLVLGLNKADLLAPEEVIERTEAYRALLPTAEWLLFSAFHGNGIDELLQMLVDALPEGPRYYPIDQTTDAFVRDISAELIREQIFLQMRDELPYGTAVEVTEFEERDNGMTHISATIYVERQNHKKIVIGAKGTQLRKIGTAARREIEELIQGRVFLTLWVKVEPNWRRNEQALQRLGYLS
jgi:GTP-binding protein Era